jgi:ribose 5-phosphate isomerase A
MDLKQQAATRALDFVESGMIVGLGSGSTSARFLEALSEQLKMGLLQDILGIPTSRETEAQAKALGIPLTNLADHPRFDLAVDGADEVDPDLDLIKGLGRALLREKIVEVHANRFVVIVDESKLVSRLGTRGPLPVEIAAFEADSHVRWLNTLDCRAELWREEHGEPIETDNGNYLARCWFPDGIDDAYALARILSDRPGILEHGLFLKMAHTVIVATREGTRVENRKQ